MQDGIQDGSQNRKNGIYQELAFDMQCKWLILMKGIDFEVL